MLAPLSYTATALPLFLHLVGATLNPSSFLSSTVLSRDVVIIGGGSSGTYAAVQLKQAGYSIAVVEKESRLGGHVDTFRDPVTGGTFDYGVVALLNTSVVRDYFALLEEGLAPYPGPNPSVSGVFANFRKDGLFVDPPSSIPWTDPAAVFASLQAYTAQVSNYPFLQDGYNLPSPVPADLLLPFGDFLAKYGLQAMARTAFNFVQGMGNVLATTTLYVFKYIPKTTIDAYIGLGPPPVISASHNFQALYDKAAVYLGNSSNVLLSSNVLAIDRTGPRVLVVVLTPSGPKLISAKKLLVAIQPKLTSLQSLGLDLAAEETKIFGQFNHSYYWDIVIKNSGIPSNLSVSNVDINATLGIPPMPGFYGFAPSPINGYTVGYYGSPSIRTDDQVRTETLQTVAKIVSANGLPPSTGSSLPQIVGFNNHKPFWLSVPPASIAAGFYGQLNSLQGKRNTWWTGATFVAHDSTAIWNWTHASLLPRLKASL